MRKTAVRCYLAGLAIMVGLPGCTATFGDVHHFATVDKSNGEVVNIFRVTVSGEAINTNARYLSGYYDERAIDLFFNEVQSTPLDSSKGFGAAPSFFNGFDCADLDPAACAAKREQRLATIPIGNDSGKKGAFVLLLSTNADAIANTIGAFSESDVVMQSVMYLATKEKRRDAAIIEATTSTTTQQRRATMDTIDALSKITGAAGAPLTPAQQEQRWLAILRAAAAGIAPQAPPGFTTIAEANAWFARQPRGLQQ
ncbi:hypothetical protein EEB18_000415 [Sphingopyxis sp. OPL5]|uniref:hypothetical protein n=1 Tax=Sphingopyxis sp. OPL5 TaxID=2486273 RepID=UPI00164DEB5D|nr:hypothetical protein [Sphingopyxis sp. OPL5]QNO27504.1 hypothetical protein EEB18_000415 [Sphingopyxis sp. OPL5]